MKRNRAYNKYYDSGHLCADNNTRQRKQRMLRGPELNMPPPPSFAPGVVPHRSHSTRKDPMSEAIKQHLLCNIYIWLKDGDQSFWMYPVRLNNDILYGYVWDNYKWIFTYIYLNQIHCFY